MLLWHASGARLVCSNVSPLARKIVVDSDFLLVAGACKSV